MPSREIMMKKLFIVVALMALTGTSTVGQTASDEADIRRVLSSYASARQSGDGPAQAKFYSEDADEWRSTTRRMVTGRSEIAKDLMVVPSPTRKFSLQVESLRFVAPSVALVDTASFGTLSTPNTHGTYVLVKTNGTWLIHAARIFRYPEAQ